MAPQLKHGWEVPSPQFSQGFANEASPWQCCGQNDRPEGYRVQAAKLCHKASFQEAVQGKARLSSCLRQHPRGYVQAAGGSLGASSSPQY